MRVLAVGNMYPPHHLGGYELVWRSAMRHLRDGGHVARVLTTGFHTGSDEPDDLDVFRDLRWYWRDHRWPRIGWRGRIALERHNAAVLEHHLRELDPDVVSWWAMGGMSLSLIERVRRLGLPAVAFVADDWLLYAPRVDRWSRPFRRGEPLSALAPLAERATGVPARIDLDGAAHYVLISEAVRAAARESGLRLPGSQIAHLGVDPAFLDRRPEREWSWRLLYVGRIDQRKGIRDAVSALAHLPESATLTVVGAGDRRELDRIRAIAAGLGVLDRLHLQGMLSHTQLPAAYEAADVLLFPVRWREPWGIVPLEAMGFGRPVVATGLGGSAEYLRDGENALLVGPGDPAALAAAVRRLATRPELRRRLIAAGLHTAAGHTETMFNQAVLAALRTAVRN